METKMRILLMFTTCVDMKDENGKPLCGVSAEYYFFGKNGEALESKYSADGNSGIRRSKVFLPEGMEKKVDCVPGIYDGNFEMAIGSDGKPVLKLIDINYVGKASITLKAENSNSNHNNGGNHSKGDK